MLHRFGPFRFDTDQRQLFRSDEPVALLPKVADTLQVLLERRGRTVEKSELMRLVWPDAVVEETGLARNISLLRKALGDDSETWVQTVPKRGYRFAAQTAEPQEPVAPPRRWPLAAAVSAIVFVAAIVYWQFFIPGPYLRSGGSAANVAVLPFDCTSPGCESSGMPKAFYEILTAEIARIQGVQVLSPSTVNRYRQTGVPPQVMTRILGMDAVLEGALQNTGATLAVTARLSDVHTGRIIWASSYERPAANLYAAEREIAAAIAAAVAPYLRATSTRDG